MQTNWLKEGVHARVHPERVAEAKEMGDSVDLKEGSRAEVGEALAWEVSSVRKVVLALSKTLTNLRFYLSNNPLVLRSKKELYEGLEDFLKAWNSLDLDITDQEILYRGNSVYEGGNKARSLTFLLYRDGLRRISFRKGLSLDELEAFLEIVCQALEKPDDETDIVGSLWTRDLPNIEYTAVDVFVDVEEGPLLPPGAEKPEAGKAGHREQVREPGEETGAAPSSVLECERLKQEKEALQSGALESLTPEEIRRKLEPLVQFSPVSKLGEILLDLIELEEDFWDRNHLLDLLEEYLADLALAKEFAQASLVVCEARETLNRCVSKKGELEQLLNSLSQKLNSVASSEAARKAMREVFPGGYDKVLSFLQLVGPAAIPILVELVPAAEDVRSKAALRAVVASLAKDDVSRLSAAIRHPDPRIVREGAAVLGRIRDPRGLELLRVCLNHEDVSVRIQTLHALRKIEDSEATKLTLEFLDDPDQEVRILAAKVIDVSREPFGREAIEKRLKSRTFRLRPTRERIALIQALRRTKSDEMVPVFAPFFRRGWFRRDEEEAVMAAIVGALHSLGTESARKLLERGSRLRKKAIAIQCERALRQAADLGREKEGEG